MKRIKPFYTFVLVCISLLPLNKALSQGSPIGAWQDYLSYSKGASVTVANNLIYCASGAGVFSYNTSDNSIERFSKVSGLSDVNPSVIRYNPTTNSVVIGYPDGNIDIIQNNTITNIPALKNGLLQGNISIYGMCFDSNIAYIGCGQGILQVDLNQYIILNTFNIGPGGTAEIVYGTAIFNDTLYAATQNGIQTIALNNPNPKDYTKWYSVPCQPTTVLHPGALNANPYNIICAAGDSLYTNWAGTYTGTGIFDTAYIYSNGKWSYAPFYLISDELNSLQVSKANGKNYLTASTYGTLWEIDLSTFSRTTSVNAYPSGATPIPEDAFYDGTNIWIADLNLGLVKNWVNPSGAKEAEVIDPPGPFSNDVTCIAIENNDIYITPGGYDASYGPDYIYGIGTSAFNNGSWHQLVTYDTVTHSDSMNDINVVAIDPTNPMHAYAGSWNGGLLEYNNNAVVATYGTSTPNGPQPVQGSPGQSRVGGIAFDTLGNVWITNGFASSNFLSVKKKSGAWSTFDFSNSIGASETGIVVSDLLVTQSQAKWMMMYGTGILVYQDNGTFATPGNSNTILITNQTGNGALPSLNIFCMAEDQNGSIWVGTDASVVVFYSPDNVTDGNHDWDAQPVYVQQNGYTQYLMQNQTTTAIAIDGANRKWIGTQGGGAFLMSADGTQQIYNFTAENSPLISNNITSIAINQNTGEVFFGTDKGVVSYKGDAIQGDSTYGNLFAYPNPVPHGYSGPIAIKGMVTNSDVRITTVSGEIVYHTTSLGGQAVWNGTNFAGTRVQTGVYLVFCISPDGTQTAVGKLLFIN